MTEHDLAELRAWSAGVCGYTSGRRGEYVRTIPGGLGHEFLDSEDWLPDQNDAQALEVLDAVIALLPDAYYELIERKPEAECVIRYGGFYFHRREHESRRIAILTACRAAWDAMKKGAEHAAD